PPPVKESAQAPQLQRAGPVDTPQLWMVWKVPGRRDGTRFQARLVADMLGDEITAALVQSNLRFSALRTQVQELEDVTLLSARLSLVNPADAAALAKQVSDHLAGMEHSAWTRRWNAEHLKQEAWRDLYRDLENIPVRDMARVLRATGKPTYIGARQQELQTGLAGLEAYVKQHLRPQDTWAMVVVPDGRGLQVPVSGADITKASAALSSPLGDSDVPVSPGLDVRRTLRGLGLEGAEHFTLSNKLKVVAQQRGGIPLVEARMLLANPPAQEVDSRSAMFHQLVQNWRAGATLEWGTDPWWLDGPVPTATSHDGFHFSDASVNFVPVLQSLRRKVEPPSERYAYRVRLDREALWKRIQQRSQTEARSDQARARIALTTRLFPGRFLGTFTEQDLESYSEEALKQWHDTWVRPERTALVLVGDLPPREELLKVLEAQLGRWTPDAGAAPRPVAGSAMPTSRSVVLVDAPGQTYAHVELALRGPAPDGARDAVVDVLLPLLEQRLSRLPASKQAVARFTAGHVVTPDAYVLHLQALTETARVTDVLDQALGELNSLEQEAPRADEVEQARWSVARAHVGNAKTSAQRARLFSDLQARGLPADHWEKYPDHLAAVTPESLRAWVG
ncbi:insulinase family protein, partial [Pyxidicoccus fallax]